VSILDNTAMNKPTPVSSTKRRFLIAAAVILGTAGLAVAGSAWWVKRNVYASSFTPVALTSSEQSALTQKMETLSAAATKSPEEAAAEAKAAEELAKRTLTLSDREINAKLAEQGLGEQVKVEFGNGDAAITTLVPVDKEVPFIGGTTLRLRFSFNAKMGDDKKFAMSLKDVSVGGVPMPNAWLGQLKGVNLFTESQFSNEPALKAFAAGIRDFSLSSGAMQIVLNE
jgi:hypothetical protein